MPGTMGDKESGGVSRFQLPGGTADDTDGIPEDKISRAERDAAGNTKSSMKEDDSAEVKQMYDKFMGSPAEEATAGAANRTRSTNLH